MRMSVTPDLSVVGIMSLVFQVLFLGIQEALPPAYPQVFQRSIRWLIGAAAIVCTWLGISLYPVAGPVKFWMVAIGLVAFAAIPPLAGLAESKWARDGQAVFSTGAVPGTENRFPGHLLTNILGALAASAFLWVAYSTSGFAEFVANFPHAAAFNIMLPLPMIAVFSFVRWQQVNVCPALKDEIKLPGWEAKIRGFSLRHWHQTTNVLYLVAVAFLATTTFMYLVAYAMEQAKSTQSLSVSWQVIIAIVIGLGFLYACGMPWSRKNKAVYLTFLTGTPAGLGAAIIWLSWFKSDLFRNIAAASIVVVGYILYCAEVVWASRTDKKDVHVHYFVAAGIAVILLVMLGALYLTD